MSRYYLLLLSIKNSKKLRIILMLKIIKIKSNFELNKLDRIKTYNNIMFLNLIIFQKLVKFLIPIILLNRNLKQEL